MGRRGNKRSRPSARIPANCGDGSIQEMSYEGRHPDHSLHFLSRRSRRDRMARAGVRVCRDDADGDARGGMHAQMALDGQQIMMGQGGTEWGMLSAHEAGAATQGVFIYLADVDAHYERARAAGAPIDKAPEDLPYGRSYTARDLDGHPWFFTTPPANG